MRPKNKKLGATNHGPPLESALDWANSLTTHDKNDFKYIDASALRILCVEIESGGPYHFCLDCDKWWPAVCASASIPKILRKLEQDFANSHIRLTNPIMGARAIDYWDMLCTVAEATGMRLAIPLPLDLTPASPEMDNWIKFAATIDGHGHIFTIDLKIERLIDEGLPTAGADLPFYVAQELDVKNIDVGIVTSITYANDDFPPRRDEIATYVNHAAAVPQLLSIAVESNDWEVG